MDKINKNLIIGVLSILVVIFGVLWYKSENKSGVSVVDETLKCNQLLNIKKTKYFADWRIKDGRSEAIFNKKLNSCLALNTYASAGAVFDNLGDNLVDIINLENDENLLFYHSTPKGSYIKVENGEPQNITCNSSYIYFEYAKNGDKVKDDGCERYDLTDKMSEQVKGFGFTLFSQFK